MTLQITAAPAAAPVAPAAAPAPAAQPQPAVDPVSFAAAAIYDNAGAPPPAAPSAAALEAAARPDGTVDSRVIGEAMRQAMPPGQRFAAQQLHQMLQGSPVLQAFAAQAEGDPRGLGLA